MTRKDGLYLNTFVELVQLTATGSNRFSKDITYKKDYRTNGQSRTLNVDIEYKGRPFAQWCGTVQDKKLVESRGVIF